FLDCPTLACSAERQQAPDKTAATGVVYERLLFRHWDRWQDGARTHLFVQSLDGGAPVDVSAGLDGDVVAAPFAGAGDIVFSPDGQSIVFAARLATHDEAWSTNYDLYRAPVNASAPPVNLTAANTAMDIRPVFSPDGGTLAYLATATPGYESDRRVIVLKDLASGATRPLTAAWDRSVDDLAFLPAGNILIALARDTGQRALWAISLRSGAATRLTGAGTVHGFDLVKNQIVYSRSDLGAPADLYGTRANGSRHRRVTAVNETALRDIALAAFEPFSFAGWAGETVHGYVMKPARFAEGEKYPVVFLIHGGPQSSFANVWHDRWNVQALAAAGYGVVFVDFHGSTGYGQSFTDSIAGDWGGKPLEDWRRGLDAALAQFPWLDGARVCAIGGSYGGYAVNWIAGQWPDRFACLINHAGVFDLRAMAYTTDELWFTEHDFAGPYYAQPALYERFNPALYVEKWQTPMLVIHGGKDFRVPATQGLATFTALQRRGIASRLLYFPDEGHHIGQPANALVWHRAVLDWLARWLKPDKPQ
ncbi:MAG: S9 family peptidase, partial [Alphaproteobacteria bacterium]